MLDYFLNVKIGNLMNNQNRNASKPPTGVIILASLQLINGILGIFESGITLITGGILAIGGTAANLVEAQSLGIGLLAFTVIVFVLSLISIMVSIGLFSLKKWAYNWTLFVQLFSIASQLPGVFAGEQVVSSIIAISISCGIIYYLNTSGVKRAFKFSDN